MVEDIWVWFYFNSFLGKQIYEITDSNNKNEISKQSFLIENVFIIISKFHTCCPLSLISTTSLSDHGGKVDKIEEFFNSDTNPECSSTPSPIPQPVPPAPLRLRAFQYSQI